MSRPLPHPFRVGGARVRRPIAPRDALHADGPVLRDRTGTDVVLQGTNLGGWLIHEWWISPTGSVSLDRGGWIASAHASAPGSSPRLAIDGDDATSWVSGGDATAGRWLEVDMGEARTFDQVSMRLTGVEVGPTRVRIEVSGDRSDWRLFGVMSGADGRRSIRSAYQTARYVRVVDREGRAGGGVSPLRVGDLRLHATDEYNLRRVLTHRFGPSESDRLLAAHQTTWIGAADLDHIIDLRLNLVRVPLAWQVLMHDDGTMKGEAAAFGRLDWLVAQATRRGLYVVLDLHGAPGGANPADSGGQAGSNRLWTDFVAQGMTERIWRAVAKRYRDQPAVAGYDLLNEPVSSDDGSEDEQQVRAKFELVDRLYRAIREVDRDHVIFIPVYPSLDQAPHPDVYGWSNVVYETHHFGFDTHDDEAGQERFVHSSLEQVRSLQRELQAPLFAGEFWFSRFTGLFGEFIEGLNELGISWANWTYKQKNRAGARFPEGIEQGPNWGFFYDGPDAEPDIDRDDAATLEAKWRRYSTDRFRPNLELAQVISPRASGWRRSAAHRGDTR